MPDTDAHYRSVGQAHALLAKHAAAPVSAPKLAGRLYLSKSGWLLLSVPNALLRGLFSALNEPGVELPYHTDGSLNAHISVVRKEEVEKAGGEAAFEKDRGRVFHYQLQQIETVEPPSWDGVSRVWMVRVKSPELETLRKSYGLTPLPKNNEHAFHVTFAVRRTNVLRNNEVAKAAELLTCDDLDEALRRKLARLRLEQNLEAKADGGMLSTDDLRRFAAQGHAKRADTDENGEECPDGECCPHCHARLEREPYSGTCNRCGEDWPLDKEADAERRSKETIRAGGLTIKVEYRKGDTRKGKSADGKPWSRVMKDAYGRIQGTKGADGAAIDVFLGPEPEKGLAVHVVSQVDPDTGAFDEHKVMMGYASKAEAREAYLRNYPDGWGGLGSIATHDWEEFEGLYGPEKVEKKALDEETALRIATRLAAAGGLATGLAALSWKNRKLEEVLGSAEHARPGDIPKILRHFKLPKELPVTKVRGLGNAAYIPAGLEDMDYVYDDKDADNHVKLDRSRRHGAIIYDPTHATPAVLAHEGGHASIANNHAWYHPARFNQEYLRPVGNFLNTMAPAAAGVIGAGTANPVAGLLAGAVGGGLTGLPELANEYQASSRARGYLDKHVDPAARDEAKGQLSHAFHTYAISNMVPSLAAGAIGGGLGMLLKGGSVKEAVDWGGVFARAAKGVKNTGRFMAGVPAGGRVTPRAVGRFTFAPRYPGLDRPLDESLAIKAHRALGGSGLPSGVAPRAFDRTRSAIGSAIRMGPYAQAAAAGGLAAANLSKQIQPIAAEGIYQSLGTTADNATQPELDYARGVAERAGAQMPGMLPELARGLAGGGDQSAIARAHYDAIKQLAVPKLRYDLTRVREQHPYAMGALDAVRSLTPAGAAMTIGKNLIKTDTPPDYAGVVRNVAEKYGPEIAANPMENLESPFARFWRRSLLPADDPAMQQLAAKLPVRPDAPLGKAVAANPDVAEGVQMLKQVAANPPTSKGQALEMASQYRPVPGSKLDSAVNQVGSAAETGRYAMGLLGKAMQHPWTTAGIVGGGALAGGALGAGLGNWLAPDDENVTFATRRRRDRIRGALTGLGGVAGLVGVPYLAAKYLGPATPKAAGALDIELATRPVRRRRRIVQRRPAPAVRPPTPQLSAEQEYQAVLAQIQGGKKGPRPKVAALRPDAPPSSDYQDRAAAKVNDPAGNGRVLMFHGLGTGKSRTAVMAAEQSGDPYTAVVPAALRPNFEGEIGRWADGGTPSQVMSYTQVASGQRPETDPGTLIVDEAHRLRNPESAQTKAVSEMAAKAKRLVLLSGSPVINAPGDLAVPMSLLTGEKITPEAFERRYVGTETVSPGFWGWLRGVPSAKVPAVAHEDELLEKLRGKVDYQAPKDPQGVRTNDQKVEVPLSRSQESVHRLLWNQVPWLTRWKLENDYPISKSEANRLRSFLSGPRQAALSTYTFQAKPDAGQAFDQSAKLRKAYQLLREKLDADPKNKALVYSNFPRAGLVPYAAGLARAGIPYSLLDGSLNDAARKEELAKYNAGQSRVLLYGPSAAEGISAKGTQLIQLLDPHWNESRMRQARGRGLRFDSHADLPDDLKAVTIQRFTSKSPEPGFISKLFGGQRIPTADEVLERQAARREALLDRFRDVLRRAGTEPAPPVR